MALKGTEARNIITAKILETFNGAFIDGKNIRIPIKEAEHGLVEIKCSLTVAKDILSNINNSVSIGSAFPPPISTEVTPQEEKTVEDLMKKLGMI